MLVGETSSLLIMVKEVKRGGSKIFFTPLEFGSARKRKADARTAVIANVDAMRSLLFGLRFGFCAFASSARGIFGSSGLLCTGVVENCF